MVMLDFKIMGFSFGRRGRSSRREEEEFSIS